MVKLWRKEQVSMKKSKYSAEQVTLRQAESGTPVPEVCRKMEISEQTFYRWRRLVPSGGPGTDKSRTMIVRLYVRK
jgi:transposase-like protein